MPVDELGKTRASMQAVGGDDSSGYLAGLGKLLVPGNEEPLAHLLAMSRMSPRKLQACVIALNSYFRTTSKPPGPQRKVLDLWPMSDGPRLAILSLQASISTDGRGRSELVDVLAGFTRFVKSSRIGRLFGRGESSEDKHT